MNLIIHFQTGWKLELPYSIDGIISVLRNIDNSKAFDDEVEWLEVRE